MYPSRITTVPMMQKSSERRSLRNWRIPFDIKGLIRAVARRIPPHVVRLLKAVRLTASKCSKLSGTWVVKY